MEYYIIFMFFLFYIFLELGVQNSSGILTDNTVYVQWLLSKWNIGTNFINLDVYPVTFNSRFLGKSYWTTWLRLETSHSKSTRVA